MNLRTNCLWSLFRPEFRPRHPKAHHLVPEVSGLEERKLMATLDSVAYSSILNTQVNDIVYGNGELVEVRASILYPLAGNTTTVLETSGVKSVGIAFNPINGTLVRTMVMTNGAAYQNGVFQGMGVESETVTFTPTGVQVNSVVYSNGDLWQVTSSGGAAFLGGNVKSASLAYDKLGNAVEDIVFTNDVLVEYDGYNNSAHVLADNVVSIGVAIGTLFGECQEVVYSDGEEFQDGQNPILGTLTLGILGPTQHDNGRIF